MERSGFPETIFRYFGNGAQRISRNHFSLFREWSAADFPKQLFVISGMERSGFPETTFRYFGNGAQRISRNNFSLFREWSAADFPKQLFWTILSYLGTSLFYY